MSKSFVTPWTVAPSSSVHGFSRQEYWSGLQFPSPGHLPVPGIKPASPALAGRFSTPEPFGKPVVFTLAFQLLSRSFRLNVFYWEVLHTNFLNEIVHVKYSTAMPSKKVRDEYIIVPIVVTIIQNIIIGLLGNSSKYSYLCVISPSASTCTILTYLWFFLIL